MGRACPSLLESLALWLIDLEARAPEPRSVETGWLDDAVPGAFTVGVVGKGPLLTMTSGQDTPQLLPPESHGRGASLPLSRHPPHPV